MFDTLYLGAAPDTTWPLDITTFEQHLRQVLPDLIATRRHSRAVGREVLSFTATVAGVERHGVFADQFNLALSDGTPADWADTIAAVLALLPADTPTVAMTDQNPAVTPLPATADAALIQHTFEQLIAGG